MLNFCQNCVQISELYVEKISNAVLPFCSTECKTVQVYMHTILPGLHLRGGGGALTPLANSCPP